MSYSIESLGLGYQSFAAEPTAGPGPFNAEWGLLRDIVSQARIGRFDLMRTLRTTIEAATEHRRLHSTACRILGDGGLIQDLETLVQVKETVGFENSYDIIGALTFRGRLADIPVIFSFYERNQDRRGAFSAQLWLEWLLRKPGEPEFPVPDICTSWEEYRNVIAKRYFSIWSELGTNMVHIYRGGIFDLRGLAEFMLSEAKRGSLSVYDRALFEANTGWCCSKWYNEKKRPMYLQVAADLEEFLERDFALAKPGQRFFMGHPLPDVAQDPGLFTRFPAPSNSEGRGVFEVDASFDMEWGFDWLEEGYFYKEPRVPPTAAVPNEPGFPWLTLHTCLREAKLGNLLALEKLALLVAEPSTPDPTDDFFLTSTIELLADAANDATIAPWRQLIEQHSNLYLVEQLCLGLLRRGLLSDVPRVLEVYRRNPQSLDLQIALSEVLAFAPLDDNDHFDNETCCEVAESHYQTLRDELGRDDVIVFRGALASTRAIAREVIDLQYGPTITMGLRYRFERATGLDCSHWAGIGGFSMSLAASTAQRFLDDGGGEGETPGELYFFGHLIQVR